MEKIRRNQDFILTNQIAVQNARFRDSAPFRKLPLAARIWKIC